MLARRRNGGGGWLDSYHMKGKEGNISKKEKTKRRRGGKGDDTAKDGTSYRSSYTHSVGARRETKKSVRSVEERREKPRIPFSKCAYWPNKKGTRARNLA